MTKPQRGGSACQDRSWLKATYAYRHTTKSSLKLDASTIKGLANWPLLHLTWEQKWEELLFLLLTRKEMRPPAMCIGLPLEDHHLASGQGEDVCSDSGFSVINCTVWWYLWGCSCQDQNGGALQSVSLSLSFQPLVVPGPGRRVPTVGSSSLYMSPSACSTPPNPPRRPTVSLAEIEIASVLCVVCCRWHGACGRTDRPLCWPVIGHPRARGSMPSAFTNSQVPCSLSLCFALLSSYAQCNHAYTPN